MGGEKNSINMAKKRFQKVGHQTPLEEENRRLKRELERVQQERDIRAKKWRASFHGKPNAHINLSNSTSRNFPLW